MGPLPACLDTYRELFGKLDKQGHWLSLLDEEGLLRARSSCEEGGKAWAIFFHGTDGGDHGDIIGSFRALSERARSTEQEMDINAYNNNNDQEMVARDDDNDIDNASAVVRRELMLALVDRISGDENEIYEDTYENGTNASVYELVAGDNNGSTSTSNNGERKRPRSPNNYNYCFSTNDAAVLPDFQRSAVPLARKDIASAIPDSFSSLLGAGNPVLRSVRSKQRIFALRAAALSRSQPPIPTKAPPNGSGIPNTEYIISCNNNDDNNNTNAAESCLSEERIVALGRAAAALVLEHVGYTHASTRALDVLVDASCSLVRDAGMRLASARERLDSDSNAATEKYLYVANGNGNPNGSVNNSHAISNRATLANAALTDVRGGAAALQSYATYEARKAAAELVNSEARLTNACIQRGIDPATVHMRSTANANGTSEAAAPAGIEDGTDNTSSKLNAATWAFGLLPQGARIDLLESAGTHPPPPRAMVCRVLGVNDPADCGVDKMDVTTAATEK